MAIHTGFSLQLEALKREFARQARVIIDNRENDIAYKKLNIDSLQKQIDKNYTTYEQMKKKYGNNFISKSLPAKEEATYTKVMYEILQAQKQLDNVKANVKAHIAIYSNDIKLIHAAQQELNAITPENLKQVSVQTIHSLKQAPSVTTILSSINQLIDKQQHPKETSVVNKLLDGDYYYAAKAGLFNFVNSVASSVVGLWNKTPYSTLPTQEKTLETEKSEITSQSSVATALDELGFDPDNSGHRTISQETQETMDLIAPENLKQTENTLPLTTPESFNSQQNIDSKNTQVSKTAEIFRPDSHSIQKSAPLPPSDRLSLPA